MDGTGARAEAEGRTRYASAAGSLSYLLHEALLMLGSPSRSKRLRFEHHWLRRAQYTGRCLHVEQGFMAYNLVEAASELPYHCQVENQLPQAAAASKNNLRLKSSADSRVHHVVRQPRCEWIDTCRTTSHSAAVPVVPFLACLYAVGPVQSSLIAAYKMPYQQHKGSQSTCV